MQTKRQDKLKRCWLKQSLYSTYPITENKDQNIRKLKLLKFTKELQSLHSMQYKYMKTHTLVCINHATAVLFLCVPATKHCETD